MTPPPAPQAANDPPPCTPAAVRAAIAALCDSALLRRYDEELDGAYERARSSSDITVLEAVVRRWRFTAHARHAPEEHADFVRRIQRYLTDGPPPPHERISRSEILERFDL